MAGERVGEHYPLLSPEAQRLQDLLGDRPPLSALSVPEAREQSRARRLLVNRPTEPVAQVVDRTIDGSNGDLAVRCYTPAPLGRRRPAVVYFHGGGWVLGDLDGHDAFCRQITNRTGAAVISVDYHLAPEHPFPAAVDDAVQSFRWVVHHADQLDVIATRVALGGDSSGGNLAAAAALRLRDGDGPQPIVQLLVYPVLRCAVRPESFEPSLGTAFLDPASMAWYCTHYLPRPEDVDSPIASPLLAEDLAGLPPAVMVIAEIDVLRPAIDAYCERLRTAGVPFDELRYPGMFHGFATMSAEMPTAARAVDELTAALAARLAAPS